MRLHFDCVDKRGDLEEWEVVPFGELDPVTCEVTETYEAGEAARGAPFEEYLEFYDRELDADDPVERTAELMLSGRHLGSMAQRVRIRAVHPAVDRRLSFRELPLVGLLYALDERADLYDAVLELDLRTAAVEGTDAEAPTAVLRYALAGSPAPADGWADYVDDASLGIALAALRTALEPARYRPGGTFADRIALYGYRWSRLVSRCLVDIDEAADVDWDAADPGTVRDAVEYANLVGG